ncbi:MAG TPA: glycosyltransferase family 4 protein [Kiritimatiellia bacterium]|nr:glycosyltransferase family 4 protein [Kiritimatiellia bacterium]
MTPFTTTFIFPIGRTLGGANIWSARMCGHLERRGVATAAVLHTNPGWHPDGDLPIPEATRTLICGGRPVAEANRRDVQRYAKVYAEALPAVIVPNWNDATYAACAELARSRPDAVRVVGVAHGNNESYFGTLERYEPILHGMIAVSDEIAEELRRRFPHRVEDIQTRACPVDVATKVEREPPGAGQPMVVTYAGRITNHEKRVSDLMPLVRELGRRGVDFRFRVIGEGGYLPTLRGEWAELPGELRARVSLEGLLPPDRLPEVWSQSQISVLVSDSEGTSISMLESMAAGCVPVVTRVSGTAAVIRDGLNGFTVPVGDVGEMAGHISRLADNPEEWARISGNAVRTVRERYAYPDYVDWFVDQAACWQAAPPRPWPKDRQVLSRPYVWPAWIRRVGDRMNGVKRRLHRRRKSS